MRPLPPDRSISGFTLLEMLIVLALLSMLVIVLTGTIFLGITARARVTAGAADQQDFASLRRLIVVQLGHAYPDWITTGSYKSVDFDGTSDRLTFLAPALGTQGQGLAHYWLSVSHDGGGNAILLRTAMDGGGQSAVLTTDFAKGLASIRFRYFGIISDGGPSVWQDEWRMRSVPPEMVALQVSFPKGDRRYWPIIFVHPEIEADITCVIDAGTHRCAGR